MSEAIEDQIENNEIQEKEEVVITLGDEEVKQDTVAAPDWVKDLRKRYRESEKKNKELEAKLNEAIKPVKTGQKPKIEDFDYDSDKFTQALEDWYSAKRKEEEEEENSRRQLEQQEKEWNETLQTYELKKTELELPDYDSSEEAVKNTFTELQQSIMLSGLENPAAVIYALGKNPERAKTLAGITNPVKFSVAIGKLEAQMKISKQIKKPPKAEEKIEGSAPKSGITDGELERLREEAYKTGDYSKVLKYKQSKKT